ncbi:MAG TPA: M14 family zinc carboxypeptidase [Thermoguttaceae bacterium]|nr:M14 family zinc carboxypeptidase [Thermoguttaceae bacterium]
MTDLIHRRRFVQLGAGALMLAGGAAGADTGRGPSRGQAGGAGPDRQADAAPSPSGPAPADGPADGPAGKPDVRIAVGFEGSCPHSPEGVRQEGPGKFRILPSWRPSPGIGEEAVGRSTRLGFRVVNKSRSPQTVDLRIDWQYDEAPPKDRPSFVSIDEFMAYRDFVVVRGPQETGWRTVMVDVAGSVGSLRLRVPPGETEVHWHPPYTYTQGEQFVASLRDHPLAHVEKIGQSEEGRNVWLIKITDDSPRAKKPALIRARVHAYESAGSYAMEGMVGWLLRDDPYAAAALREYAFHVIPMSNPDGVFNGLGRLTAPRGADLTWVASVPDRVHDVMKQTADRLQPVLFVDLHNWQNKHVDGLLGLELAVRERFVRFMPDQLPFGKQWSVRDPGPVPSEPPAKESLGAYCRRSFGATSVAFEFPWFGRTTDDVRTTGRTALWALLRALDEPPAGVSWRPAMWSEPKE